MPPAKKYPAVLIRSWLGGDRAKKTGNLVDYPHLETWKHPHYREEIIVPVDGEYTRKEIREAILIPDALFKRFIKEMG